MEFKYVAACDAAREAIWMRKFLAKLEVILSIELLISMILPSDPRDHGTWGHATVKDCVIRKCHRAIDRSTVTCSYSLPPRKDGY